MTLPKPKKQGGPVVLLAIPAMDGRVETLTVLGLIQVMAATGGAVSPYFLVGNSDVQAARNMCVHYFKHKTKAEWLVFVDSDIGFDLEAFTLLMEGDEDMVIAPYAKKAIGEPPVEWGMGFCRIHRRVFEQLDAWLTPEGSEMLQRYMHKGELHVDYFVHGALSGGMWYGEDTAFWHWCAQHGEFSKRMEKRARLVHVGRFYYGYPDQTPGLVPVHALEEGAQ